MRAAAGQASRLQANIVLAPDIFTAFSAGLTVGAFTWGLLGKIDSSSKKTRDPKTAPTTADIIGRKWAFNLTCLITSVFGMLIAAPSNYGAICFLSAMCGFGLGGCVFLSLVLNQS